MDRSFVRKTAAVMAIVTLLPMFSSCSLFKKKAVLTAASDFVSGISSGAATDILQKTDGLEKEYKKSFKDLLDEKNYSDEEKVFNTHIQAIVSGVIDEKSVKVTKDTATVSITFTSADLEALQKGDYKDINDLASAVDKADTKETEITVELKEIDKDWYVTNFDDQEFKDLFSFYGNMPVIGRGTLIDTATKLAKAIVEDESGVAIVLAGSSADDKTIATVKDAFDVDGKPTDEQKAFQTAVRSLMLYDVDTSTVEIEGNKGKVQIRISRPNFEVLAGKSFKSIPEIEQAVKNCEIITYYYDCKLERDGSEWHITNLDSEAFAGLLTYKKFNISLKSVDGTYKATKDITDQFIKYISKEYSVNIPSGCEGKINIKSTMVLQNGKFEVKIDRDAFVSDIKSFVEKNIDRIIQNTLGTTSAVGLDAMAKIAGYKDYADMKQQILNQVTTNVETINVSGLESSGTYTVDGSSITFKSSSDTTTGTIDNFGSITVEAKITDPDARKLLEAEKILMTYKKAA